MEFQYEKSRIFALNASGKVIAEITFPVSDGYAIIDHTFVDSSLRGQGVASKLVTAAVAEIRKSGLKAKPVCSYAAKWFEKHPDEADLL